MSLMASDIGCHHTNGPGISGPGGPFMFNIIATDHVVINGWSPGPHTARHKWYNINGLRFIHAAIDTYS